MADQLSEMTDVCDRCPSKSLSLEKSILYNLLITPTTSDVPPSLPHPPRTCNPVSDPGVDPGSDPCGDHGLLCSCGCCSHVSPAAVTLRNPSSAHQQACQVLLRTLTFVKNLPSYADLCPHDRALLLTSGWSDLFTVGLAQSRVHFTTELTGGGGLQFISKPPEGDRASHRESQIFVRLRASVDGVPTETEVAKIQNFVERCQVLDLDMKEYSYLMAALLFNADKPYHEVIVFSTEFALTVSSRQRPQARSIRVKDVHAAEAFDTLVTSPVTLRIAFTPVVPLNLELKAPKVKVDVRTLPVQVAGEFVRQAQGRKYGGRSCLACQGHKELCRILPCGATHTAGHYSGSYQSAHYYYNNTLERNMFSSSMGDTRIRQTNAAAAAPSYHRTTEPPHYTKTQMHVPWVMQARRCSCPPQELKSTILYKLLTETTSMKEPSRRHMDTAVPNNQQIVLTC
ncbi:peroxisome proliferator activated receptor binding [Branchiostoma belcheri]|nr:peroxisome proliferator activated receptor binding [Branchiostoma belcheri]